MFPYCIVSGFANPVDGRLWHSTHAIGFANVKLIHEQYLSAGSHLQPLPGCCLILLPPHHPCVMELEQVLGCRGQVVCFPLGVHAVASSLSLCVAVHHRLCCLWSSEPWVDGLGLFGHWHSWPCISD